MTPTPPLLDVRDLSIGFDTSEGWVRAVDDVSFRLERGQTMALVGESGSGKTLTALAMLDLLPPPGRVTAGQILLDGTDLRTLSAARRRRVRGTRIAMVFQEPAAALNSLLTIGRQVSEAVEVRARADGQSISARAARDQSVALLSRVGIPDASHRADDYPHQFSGGMCQRVLIATALALRPSVLIADEPTTALDVTLQAQILELLRGVQRETGMAMLLITHDLGVAAEMAERLAVMYAGRIVEEAAVDDLFARPSHPYTQALLECIPKGDGRVERLATIEGDVPSSDARPTQDGRWMNDR